MSRQCAQCSTFISSYSRTSWEKSGNSFCTAVCLANYRAEQHRKPPNPEPSTSSFPSSRSSSSRRSQSNRWPSVSSDRYSRTTSRSTRSHRQKTIQKIQAQSPFASPSRARNRPTVPTGSRNRYSSSSSSYGSHRRQTGRDYVGQSRQVSTPSSSSRLPGPPFPSVSSSRSLFHDAFVEPPPPPPSYDPFRGISRMRQAPQEDRSISRLLSSSLTSSSPQRPTHQRRIAGPSITDYRRDHLSISESRRSRTPDLFRSSRSGRSTRSTNTMERRRQRRSGSSPRTRRGDGTNEMGGRRRRQRQQPDAVSSRRAASGRMRRPTSSSSTSFTSSTSSSSSSSSSRFQSRRDASYSSYESVRDGDSSRNSYSFLSPPPTVSRSQQQPQMNEDASFDLRQLLQGSFRSGQLKSRNQQHLASASDHHRSFVDEDPSSRLRLPTTSNYSHSSSTSRMDSSTGRRRRGGGGTRRSESTSATRTNPNDRRRTLFDLLDGVGNVGDRSSRAFPLFPSIDLSNSRKEEEEDPFDSVERFEAILPSTVLIPEETVVSEDDDLSHIRTTVCGICSDDVRKDKMVRLGCNEQHEYCQDCLTHHCEAKTEEGVIPVKCPGRSCGYDLTPTDLCQFLSQAQVTSYEKFGVQVAVRRNRDLRNCLTPDCDYVFFHQDQDTDFQCPLCRKRYCVKCEVEWHSGQSCEEFETTQREQGETTFRAEDMRRQNYQQCPNCENWIERNQGCVHMTCGTTLGCGTEFCYVCGGFWNGHDNHPPTPHGDPCENSRRRRRTPEYHRNFRRRRRVKCLVM